MGNKKDNKWFVFLCGALIGLITFVCIYGIECVNPANDTFIINGYIERDVAQHYTGWMLFRDSEWTFPLGVGQNIARPYGNAVSFTDSIPLFAILFKVFRNILPETFQYFGLYVRICFMLQGAFGALIANIFSKSRVTDILSAFVFVLSPIFIERAFRHCALTSHFLILAALYVYFAYRDKKNGKAIVCFGIINVLAILIHPYFLPFSFGIMFAYCLDIAISEKKYVKSVAGIAASIFVTLFVGYCIGIFSVSGSFGSIGYGIFNMNLNSFINPQSKGISNWSKVISIRPLTTQWQIEGFNYLGLGVIVFCPISAIILLIKYKNKIFEKLIRFIKHYFGIIFSASALFIFALCNPISFGGLNLITIPWPDILVNKFFSIFRANGRFGWIIVYLIVIFILFSVLRIYEKNKMIPLARLICLIALQVWDIQGALLSKHAYFTDTDGDMQGQIVGGIESEPFWNTLAEKYNTLVMFDGDSSAITIPVTELFAKNHKNVNTKFEARVDINAFNELSNQLVGSLKNGSFDKSVVIVSDDIINNYWERVQTANPDVFYIDEEYVVCFSKFTDEEIVELSERYGIEKVAIDTIPERMEILREKRLAEING